MAAPTLPLAADFSLTCQVLDPVTQALRTTFAVGDEVLVRFALQVPPEAADREVNLKLAAHIRIAGISIPYTLDELQLSLPNQSPDPSGDSEWEQSGTVSESSLVEIPEGFPAGTYSLRAKASIEGVGKQACEMKVEVSGATAP